MNFEKLGDHEHYYHTHSDFFHHSHDLVHAFTMMDYTIGMHEQEFMEINVVTRGEGIHYINNNRVAARVGDVFIVPPHVAHGYLGGRGFDVFHMIISDSFMNKHIADLQQLPSFFTLFGVEPLMRGKTANPLHLNLQEEAFEATMRIFREIARYDNYGDPVEGMVRSNLAMSVIGLLCGAYTSHNAQNQAPFCEDRALTETISYIHERYYEKITVKDLCSIAHLSRSSYIKKFKEICKMPPLSYVTKIRMDSASMMLQTTNLTVLEIAHRTGFYDSSHFTRTFEAHYGISPLGYRNKHLSANARFNSNK